MKKSIVVLAMVLFMAAPVFAWDHGRRNSAEATAIGVGIGGNSSASATGGSVGDVQNVNSLEQTIAPSQGIQIEAERPFIQPTIVVPNILPQLSFGETKQIKSIITDKRLKEWNGELIIAVVNQAKTTSSKIIKKTIDLVNESAQKEDLRKCRIISLSHPSTKMWSTGGAMSVGGANNVGSGMMSGAGGIFPSYGRMTSDNMIDLIIVRVAE